jgi:hypothetical protein
MLVSSSMMAHSSQISSISLAICALVSCSLQRTSCWLSSSVFRVAGSTRSCWSSQLFGLLMVSGRLARLVGALVGGARSAVQGGLFLQGLSVLQDKS